MNLSVKEKPVLESLLRSDKIVMKSKDRKKVAGLNKSIHELTNEYLNNRISEITEDVVNKDMKTGFRESLKEGIHYECSKLNAPFLSLMNYYNGLEVKGSIEDYPIEFSTRYEKFLLAHKVLLEKYGPCLDLCEWMASIWCVILAELEKKAKRQKDKMKFDFLEQLHHEMTASFTRIFKYYADNNY